jgi:hypothetical protein
MPEPTPRARQKFRAVEFALAFAIMTITRRSSNEPRQLVTRILEEPALVRAVQSLGPRALHALVERVGLEDAGELVALATVEQLERVFDEDLWKAARAGEDERFDAARFLVWLEIMREAGDAFAADTLATMSADLVAMALHQHVHVIDLDALAVDMSERDDDALVEKALDSGLHHELGQYRVIARRHDGWDAIVNVLATLEQRHGDDFDRLLERLCHASSEYIDDNGGLYRVLTSEEMLDADTAAEREDRRARVGYVAPSQAKAFLALALRSDVDTVLAERERDPVTRAYFREYEPAAVAAAARAAEASAEAERLLALVAAAEPEAPAPPRARLPAKGDDEQTMLSRALAELAERDAARHDERLRELGYLANLVVAGVERDGERLRALDAAERALATCNRGLQAVVARTGQTPVDALARHGCDKLFRIGWRLDAR